MRRALVTTATALAGLAHAAAALGDAGPQPGREAPAAVTATRAGAPVVEIDVSARELDLGEPFFAVIRARHAPGVQVDVPDALALGPGIEELRRASSSRRDPGGTVIREVEVELAVFEVGAVELPAIPVHYVTPDGAGHALTDEVALEVRDPLAGERDVLRDIAPPLPIERRDLTWVYAAAAAAVAALAAAVVGRVRRRSALRRRAAASSAPPPSPDEEALARLEALAASGALDADDRRSAYFEMSEIVRTYLGRRYGFPALDLTTKEIRDSLDERADDRARGLALAWLEDADAVKYAGYGAGADEARDALDRAVEVVLETTRDGEAVG